MTGCCDVEVGRFQLGVSRLGGDDDRMADNDVDDESVHNF